MLLTHISFTFVPHIAPNVTQIKERQWQGWGEEGDNGENIDVAGWDDKVVPVVLKEDFQMMLRILQGDPTDCVLWFSSDGHKKA